MTIEKDENPDFFVTFGTTIYGVEVTSGVDPKEEIQRTADAKKTDRVNRDYYLMDPARPEKLRKLVFELLRKKTKKCSPSVDQLLVYLDTDLAKFESATGLLETLSKEPLPENSFSSIWVYTECILLELKHPRVVSYMCGNK